MSHLCCINEIKSSFSECIVSCPALVLTILFPITPVTTAVTPRPGTNAKNRNFEAYNKRTTRECIASR